MTMKKIGAAVCTVVLLSGCSVSSQTYKLLSEQVQVKNVKASSQEEITLSGSAEPYQEVIVSPSIEGKIKNLHADLGSYVTQGQKLAVLDEGDLAAQVKIAENNVKVAESQGNLKAMEQQIALNETKASLNTKLPESPKLPDSPTLSGYPELEAAKTAVEDAKLALTDATKEWNSINKLFNEGLASKQELEQATVTKEKIEIELKRAQEKVKTEKEKADIQNKYEKELVKYKQEKEKFDQETKKMTQQTGKSAKDTIKLQKESSSVTSQMTQISIEEAKAELDAIRNQYNKLPVVAPINGFITENKGRIGEMASPGNSLFVITNLDKLYISINVPESMINRWKENQKVKVMIPTQDISTEGKIVFIGVMPVEKEQKYPVKVLIDNANHKIRGGMKAVVTWKEESKNSDSH